MIATGEASSVIPAQLLSLIAGSIDFIPALIAAKSPKCSSDSCFECNGWLGLEILGLDW